MHRKESKAVVGRSIDHLQIILDVLPLFQA